MLLPSRDHSGCGIIRVGPNILSTRVQTLNTPLTLYTPFIPTSRPQKLPHFHAFGNCEDREFHTTTFLKLFPYILFFCNRGSYCIESIDSHDVEIWTKFLESNSSSHTPNAHSSFTSYYFFILLLHSKLQPSSSLMWHLHK